MAETVSTLLRRSLLYAAGEAPDGYRRFAVILGPLVVELAVDGEILAVTGGDVVAVDDRTAPGPADVRIATSRAAILAVLDAETTLSEAVLADRVHARGPIEDLLQAHDALLAFVHAAVRAPSTATLPAALRSGSR
jgi:hypothetical protein